MSTERLMGSVPRFVRSGATTCACSGLFSGVLDKLVGPDQDRDRGRFRLLA